jgi:CCR4-NOT transcription complex subunit 9
MHQVFPHQGPYHQQQHKQQQAQQSDWQQQQAQQHHSQHNQHHGQYASQAANAAAQQQQQQHYARGSMNANLPNSGVGNNNNIGNAGSLLGQGVNNAIGGIGGGPQADHGGNMINGGGPGGPGGDANLSDENRRVLEWIAQVLSTNAREAALLELSKKREQVPELALILWHSFGEFKGFYVIRICMSSIWGVGGSLAGTELHETRIA